MRTATYFHCQLKPMSRSAGKSAVNCAAYRTGLKLMDERYGTLRDYSDKKDVVTSFTLAPDNAPDWAHDAETLWNAVEQKENRKNSILSYEWEIAAPNELDDAHRENLARTIGAWLRDEYGVAVTVGIHNGGSRGNGLNDHFHIMMTTREIGEGGWSKNKLRDFNARPGQDNPEVDHVREQVAGFINSTLADNDSETRVTHESYRARGIDVEGTRHLGPAANALERSGVETDRGDINREILEDRLRWQMEQAQPEIDATIEADLVARFGDEFADVLKEAQAGPELPGIVEHATQDAEKLHEDTATSGGTDMLAEPRGWRERVKAFAAHALELFHDERSGAPQPEPLSPEPSPAAEQPAPETMRRSWVSRVMEASRHMLHGWQHRDGQEVAEGISEAAGIARDIASPEPSHSSQPLPAEPPGEPSRPAADVDAAEPPENRPQDAGDQAMSAFERFAASVDASTPLPDGKPLSAFDRLTAQHGEQSPTRGDPWEAFAEAYRRALTDQPELDGDDDPGFPEPEPPEPDYHGPDLDF